MASSSYYYSQMLDYSRAKRTREEQKEEYNNYVKKFPTKKGKRYETEITR